MTGPFEEEEEGAGIASDVVKVQVEDPDTPGPGPCGSPWGHRARRDVSDFQSLVRPPWLTRDETPGP